MSRHAARDFSRRARVEYRLLDGQHDAGYLCDGRPGKSVCLIEGLEPLLDFRRLDVLCDLPVEALDEIIADVILLNESIGPEFIEDVAGFYSTLAAQWITNRLRIASKLPFFKNFQLNISHL